MKKLPAKGYYFITDPGYTQKGILRDIEVALDCGVPILQYRDKDKTIREKFFEAEKAKKLCEKYEALFIVNDSIEIAYAVGADGVNVGRHDSPPEVAWDILGRKKIVGISVSTLEETKEALRAGASYLGAGPVEATLTKPDAGEATGLDLIRRIRTMTGVPVAAIGGIDFNNVSAVLEAGASLICSISAVYRYASLEQGVKAMMKICQGT